jgi:amidase
MTELQDLSAVELVGALRRKEVSAREALDAHYARVDAVNPAVNAVVTQVQEQAYRAAAAADERAAAAASPDDLPVLHGLPMTHKDTHLTRGIRTTHGSRAFADFVPDTDELIIERLHAAGVITTGKNNTPEFAAGSHTFNELFGTTNNPYDVTRSAGGSSGGAGAAIAARIQPLGDGSDMGGSLRNPAAFCNIVGFRPSYGLIPPVPARNPWSWLSRSGPMARTVADIALAMSALTGPDRRSPAPCPVPAEDFTALLARPVDEHGSRPLAGVRVGVSTDFGLGVPVEPEIVRVVEEQARTFAELGADVGPACPDLSEADLVFDVTRAFDMATNLGDVVAEHGDVIKPEVIWNVRKGQELTGPRMIEAALARGRLRAAVQEFFDSYDVLLTPTTQVLPFPSEERWPRTVAGVTMQTYVEWMRSVCLISATGCPAVSVPGGFVDGLPVGLQLVAAEGRDVDLLRVAAAYEAATGFARRAPELG